MRKSNIFQRSFMILVLASILFTACKKGDSGPAGPKGDAGAQGPVGLTGTAGQAGQVILSGTTAPAAALGNTGDFYLNKTTSDLYGPKTSAGWGTPKNLKGNTGATGAKGATGAAGKAGSVILSGTSIPATTLGVNGDYYLYKTLGLFYGPKSGTNWGTPINLTGPKGDKGDKGDPGNANVLSTGWQTIPASKWSGGSGAGATELSQPGDLGSYYGYSIGISETESQSGAILVYAKLPTSPNSARPMPIKFTYGPTSAYKGIVELRFAYGTTPGFAHWILIGAALTSGSWNTITKPIINDYLAKIQFCVVHIPSSSIAQVPASTFSDYNKVKSAFHLKD
ncbi:MAG TPA: hypothetical protein VL053_03130 [Arachidicoccus sp.]|nr:hypothetical protein [Arachidicoccus sp.]